MNICIGNDETLYDTQQGVGPLIVNDQRKKAPEHSKKNSVISPYFIVL